MNKQTITCTDEKLQDIYTSEKFRNQVAYAHGLHKTNGEKLKITCSYPVTYIVSEAQIAEAEAERRRAKAEAVAGIGNKLVFVGMGMNYETTESDDIGNVRIRTEFINRFGNRFFVEFGQGRDKTKLRIDHAINRTMEHKLNRHPEMQSEYNNYKGLEHGDLQYDYNKKSILCLINYYFDCNFSEMEIDNYNLTTDDFTCISPE